MKPSIGRIVHWVNPSTSEHHAAIVTAVTDEGAHLTVFRPDLAPLTVLSAQEGEGPDTWHWPEREEPAEEKEKPRSHHKTKEAAE